MIIDFHGYENALIKAFLLTMELAFVSLAFGLVLGILGGLAKTSSNAILRALGTTYSTIVRGVPELLWVFLIYYGTVGAVKAFGLLWGIKNLELNTFAAGVVALSLCFGAYATEVFRGALLSISKGQKEAGLALGLSASHIFFRITLPQLWRVALPGLGNLFMILMKDTSLVSVIGLSEIMRTSQLVVQGTKEPITFYTLAAVMYLSITVICMFVLYFLERRVNRGFERGR
ncbi:ABC transporter permease subunit [Pseudomonas sp. F1_0610]|uniref:ABC transporter permease n=1 Tax=Pseudomonas sp. F1_0610 TaxID=3114284 RepID=UPI0039C1F46A